MPCRYSYRMRFLLFAAGPGRASPRQTAPHLAAFAMPRRDCLARPIPALPGPATTRRDVPRRAKPSHARTAMSCPALQHPAAPRQASPCRDGPRLASPAWPSPARPSRDSPCQNGPCRALPRLPRHAIHGPTMPRPARCQRTMPCVAASAGRAERERLGVGAVRALLDVLVGLHVDGRPRPLAPGHHLLLEPGQHLAGVVVVALRPLQRRDLRGPAAGFADRHELGVECRDDPEPSEGALAFLG